MVEHGADARRRFRGIGFLRLRVARDVRARLVAADGYPALVADLRFGGVTGYASAKGIYRTWFGTNAGAFFALGGSLGAVIPVFDVALVPELSLMMPTGGRTDAFLG